MKKIIKYLFLIWALVVLLAIVFKIKMFVELFPIVGTVCVLTLLSYTIYILVAPSKKEQNVIDKKEK